MIVKDSPSLHVVEDTSMQKIFKTSERHIMILKLSKLISESVLTFSAQIGWLMMVGLRICLVFIECWRGVVQNGDNLSNIFQALKGLVSTLHENIKLFCKYWVYASSDLLILKQALSVFFTSLRWTLFAILK